MYAIEKDKTTITKAEELEFSQMGIKEVEHIEEWVINNPDILEEDLMVVSSEFDEYEEIRQRLDVLAIDSVGNLVLIELKRDQADETTDLQAIKYASYVANFSPQDIQELYRDFWSNREQEELQPEDVGERFENHLSESNKTVNTEDSSWAEFELNNKPRIILAAGNFGKEITAPVTWLNQEFGLDITCIELQAYEHANQMYVNNRIVLPVPETEEYQAKRRQKQEEQDSQKRGRAIHTLLDSGIIEAGDIVTFNDNQQRFDLKKEYDPEDEFWQAEVTGETGRSDNVRWLHNDQEDSFTGLTKDLIEEATGDRPNSVNGYNYWTKQEDNRSLSDHREDVT